MAPHPRSKSNSDRQHLMRFRVFISSPSDVTDERGLALNVINELANEPDLRGRVALEAVAWDAPGAQTPMLANMTPQDAISSGLPLPSQCELFIAIFWARFGTPLPSDYLKSDGSRYLSGTEWEYLEALQAAEKEKVPSILLYRRFGSPKVDLSDPKLQEKIEQNKRVEVFFQSLVNPDGSLRGGYNEYKNSDEFEKLFRIHLRELVNRQLRSAAVDKSLVSEEAATSTPIWQGSPFPGLRAYTEADAPIFVGRGKEIAELIDRLRDQNTGLIAVVGASGAGKSSLVAAGLLPRLKAGAIPGSKDWEISRFKPGELGDNPFLAFASDLAKLPGQSPERAFDLAKLLSTSPGEIRSIVTNVLEGKPKWSRLLLFVDQCEELFTLAPKKYINPFIELLMSAAETDRVHVVLTIRADFFPHLLEWQPLTELLRVGAYPVSTPGFGALFEMITIPASRAGLSFEEGLAERILEDTGRQPGALALMAFALSELYRVRNSDGLLTHEAYQSFDGVQGAIGERAEAVFKDLAPAVRGTMSAVMGELVEVNEEGLTARRRCPRNLVADNSDASTLVDAMTGARLFVQSRDDDDEPVVEVAHEALFQSWPRLAEWLDNTREDFRILRQVRIAAAEWEKNSRQDSYLWPEKRLGRVKEMLDKLQPKLEHVERLFTSETARLIHELGSMSCGHRRRLTIGTRLLEMGDTRPGVGLDVNGTPAFIWREVPSCELFLPEQNRPIQVERFRIAVFPVTEIQFEAFRNQDTRASEIPGNHPAVNIAWQEAVKFCRWASDRLGYKVRLPSEWEWQLAAIGCNGTLSYPWGDDWESRRANTSESGLHHSTAVGVYPDGASKYGVLDMIGNVWEWCADRYYPGPMDQQSDAEDERVARGGSWLATPLVSRVGYRGHFSEGFSNYALGFRAASDINE